MKYRFYSKLLIIVFLALLQACSSDAPYSYADYAKRQEDSIQNQLVQVPGKKPLRLLTERPYNLETPLKYFMTDITPNDVFFIRWHLPTPPTR